MIMFKRVGDFFGLDIGTNSIRVVQLGLRNNKDGMGNYVLKNFSRIAIDPKISQSHSESDKKKLVDAINTAVGQAGIKTKNMAVNMPSEKTYTTIVEVPFQNDQELAKTIKYQADQSIPTPIDETKIDWANLGQSLINKDKIEVLLASTSKEYSENKLETLEQLGLNVIAFEPDQIAMSRALNINDGSTNLIVDLGEKSTNLTIMCAGSPRLVRSIPIGFNTIVKSAVHGLGIKEEQARQFILKFGLSTDKLDGKVLKAIEATLENLVSEILKSITFFQKKYINIKVDRIILSGYLSSIPIMNQYIANYTKVATTIGNPWQDVLLTPEQQPLLAGTGGEFAVVIGLAKRGNFV